MKTLFDKIHPNGSPNRIQDIIKVYGVFCIEPARLEFIINKLCSGTEWKKVMCFYPSEDNHSKLMVFVANTSEYYLTGVEFKPEVTSELTMKICLDLNDLLFWVDPKNMIRIVCSVKREDQAEYDAKNLKKLIEELGDDTMKEIFIKPREPG